MASRYELGIASLAYGLDYPVADAARRAVSDGFDHLDISDDGFLVDDEATLPLPIGERISTTPKSGCTLPSPRRCTWDEAVARLRSQPNLRVEPGPASLLDSLEAVRAICDAVPGLRITLDTGWAVVCGYDPLEVADLAGHVQLRQARPGAPQLHPDEPGDVDFAAVVAGMRRLDYQGLFSVEYFDLPRLGLPLDDPVGHCVALAQRVRPLLD